jgi:hypothetical protein
MVSETSKNMLVRQISCKGPEKVALGVGRAAEPELGMPAGLQKDPFLSKPRTKTELCEWIGCCPRFLESEISAGRLRVRRLSARLVRIMPSDIQAWLDQALSVTTETQTV